MGHYFADFARDVRYACRLFVKSKGFTAVAVLTLALGIGANTAVFSIVNAALLRPLPYRNPDRIIDVLDQSSRESRLSKLFASYRDFQEFRDHARTVEQVAAVTWAVRGQFLSGHGTARTVTAIPVSDGFFDLLGAGAAMGRTFQAGDLQRGCSVVLSNAFWTSAFGASRGILGQAIALDKRSCVVLGVMPASFEFYPRQAQLWTLITPDFSPAPETLAAIPIARLKPGVTLAQAQSELAALHAALHRGDGKERDLEPAVDRLQDDFTWLAGRNLRTTLWVLLAAVTLVLAIACVNVANLLLGRSLVRGRELAVRTALGGGRSRLFRQLLTEGLLLAGAGGAAGVAIAYGAIAYFKSVNPVELPVGATVAISLPVLAFTVAISVVTALLFGITPAWRASRTDAGEALKSGGRGAVAGHQRVVRVMVAAEMALPVILLAGAGLLMESVLRMGAAPLGFQPDDLFAARISLPADRYPDARARLSFDDRLARKMAALPGIRTSALSSTVPPSGFGNSELQIYGRPKPAAAAIHDVSGQAVSPEYFEALDTAILRGRAFNAYDRNGSEPAAIIDESLAREYFPGADPLGQKVRLADGKEWAVIVGVAGSQKRTTVLQEMKWVDQATLYQPLAQAPPESLFVVLRAGDGGLPLGAAVPREVAALDSAVAVGKLESVRQNVTEFLAYPRFRAVVLGAFAAFALLLAAVGLHGVLGQLVAQRTQEIGVRMALGARPADVARLVARQGGVPVLAGLAIGLGCAMALGRYLSAMLYGVHPRDPSTLAAVCVVLLAAAALAMALPARRAARTDPMAALRTE